MVSYVPPYIPPSLPTYLPTAKKRFFNFAKTSQIINFKYENLPYLAVKRKNFSLGKKANFNFKSGGFLAQIPQGYSAFAEGVAQQPLVIVAQAVCNQALSAAALFSLETPFLWLHLKVCGPLKSFSDIKMDKYPKK